MSNLSRLQDAGIIAKGAQFDAADQKTIDSLSDVEVSALISISKKLPADFLQRHTAGGGSPQAMAAAPGTQTVGIVF